MVGSNSPVASAHGAGTVLRAWQFFGSTGDIRLNQPIVRMAASGLGDGYWLLAADGGVFSFGNAAFHGAATNWSRSPTPPGSASTRAVGMAATFGGGGYWIASNAGEVQAFGTATSQGDVFSNRLAVAVAAT
jgi:hypothetical protein